MLPSCSQFSFVYPSSFSSLKLLLKYIADTGEQETYADLLQKCIRAALKLKSENISKNNIICLCTPNHSNTCVPFIAAMFLGIKVTTLDPSMSIKDTVFLLKQVPPSIIFTGPETETSIKTSLKLAKIKAKVVIFGNSSRCSSFSEYLEFNNDENIFKPVLTHSEDTALILFSSGTTGLPKGICLSHAAILTQGNTLIDIGVVSSVSLYYASMYWISALVFLSAAIMSGIARVICKIFDPEQVWRLIEKYQVSSLFLSPNAAVAMCKAGRPDNLDTTSLLCLATGGGNLSETYLNALKDYLPGTFLTQMYGQTEMAGTITAYDMCSVRDAILLHQKPTSCGRPIKGISYKVIDSGTGNILGPYEQGELYVKAEHVMNGYYNKDSSEAFKDGWLKTGDIVYYDNDYCFYIIDRIKEMLKYKSWHIAPAMLENIINSHPAVKISVVVGIPHEEDGDHPMAVVVLNNPHPQLETAAEDIETFVAARVEDRQRLRAGVKFVQEVPLTPSGKIKRQELKQMVLSGQI